MFTFMHTYTLESWKGVLKNGLYRDGDGIKIIHTPYIPSEIEFNNIGRPEKQLYELLQELKCPFYIDRLQGGMAFTKWYDFDKRWLNEYKKLLGKDFWGFQIHEWASNFRTDYERIAALYEKYGSKEPDPVLRRKIWEDVQAGREEVFIEAFTPEEWSVHRIPGNREEFVEDVYELYERRCRMMDGMLIPVDSYHMAPRIEIAAGAKLLLPEVGWQIPDMRIQLAYTRGMAKAADIRWGVYYECWAYTDGVGLTIPFSQREGQDEWAEDLLYKANGADRSFEMRERGGSSRSLQERAWRYAYLSGATVLGEEYGVCNTFRNLQDYDLSPYGQVKREFIRFLDKFPEVGETYTPFAIVLPADMPIYDIKMGETYLDYPGQVHHRKIREVLTILLGHDGQYGNQGHVMKNGGFPDVFDIIHADQEEALVNYEYLIDLTGEPSFAEKHSNIVEIHEIDGILQQCLPGRVKGDIHVLYNRTKYGWIVLAMNHDGVLYDHFAGECYIPEADVKVQLETKSENIRILDGNYTDRPIKAGMGYAMTLRAGQWIMFEIR